MNPFDFQKTYRTLAEKFQRTSQKNPWFGPIVVGIGGGLLLSRAMGEHPPLWVMRTMGISFLILLLVVPPLFLRSVWRAYPATREKHIKWIFALLDPGRESPRPSVTPLDPLPTQPAADVKTGPDGTVLAWRLNPPTTRSFVVNNPTLLVVGVALLLLSVAALATGNPGGVLLVLAGGALVWMSLGVRNTPVKLEPLPVEPRTLRAMIEALRNSPNEMEREHIYIGTTAKSKRTEPVLVHEKLLQTHVEIVGATRSGKNMKGVIPIVTQLLGFDDTSFIHMDMKGDYATFQIMKATAEKNGVPFYYFSLNPNEAGHLFNFLTDPAFTSLVVRQQAEILTQAMSVTGENGSQAGFFGTINERTVSRNFEKFRAEGWPLSFSSIHRFLSNKSTWKDLKINKRDFDFSSHALAQFEKAAEDPRLNWMGTEPINPALFENAITVEKIVGRRGFVYLNLAALLQPSTAAMVSVAFAKIVLAHLVARSKSLPRVKRVYFVFDEAQEGILEPSMKTPLKQGRQFGASYIFAHQDLSDLKRDGMDMTDVVIENTAVKILMTAKSSGRGSGRDYIANTAGERLEEVESESQGLTASPNGESTSKGRQVRREKVKAFGQNELMELNLDNEIAYFEATPRSGLTRYKPGLIEIPYLFTQEEFDAYEALGWPEPDGIRSVRASDIPPPLPPPEPPDAPEPPTDPTPTAPPSGSVLKRRRPPKPLDSDIDEESKAHADALKRIGKR